MSLQSPVPNLHDVASGIRFVGSLPRALRHPLDYTVARTILRGRLAHREATFLAIVRNAIYGSGTSPYRQLLGFAGCEYGDVERMVRQDGIETSLQTLFRAGVYLTVDEFKGRRAAVRGATAIEVGPDRLRNPLAARHVPVQSGGSRSAGTPVMIDLGFIRDCAVDFMLSLEARGGTSWLKADYEVPGGGALFRLLKMSSFGAPPVRWFSQVDPNAPDLNPRYRWSVRAFHWGGRLAGIDVPSPEYVPLSDTEPIVRWMASTLRAGGVPHLWTFPSSAVRVCEAAFEVGADLRGAQFTISGEPITAARLATIARVGGEVGPRYGTIECGPIAYGCRDPKHADEMHVLSDLQALIQAGVDGPERGLPGSGLLITALRPTAPFVMLNVSMGDQAILSERSCGCPLEGLGWATHVHGIRSYEKLTAGGMTFLDRDVIHVLEEVLPARFGGGPTDYQLLEEETREGHPSLRLLVHPALGQLDEAAIVDAVLSAISQGSGAEHVMGDLWRRAGFLRVERQVPRATTSGKILHLAVGRPPEQSSEARPSGD